MSLLTLIGASLAGALLALHVLSAVLAGRRWCAGRVAAVPPAMLPPVSIVRPMRGLDPMEEAAIASTFALAGASFEALFCVEDESDPAVPFIRGLIARHPHVEARLLVGRTIATLNPKLDNVEKGWREARHDLIVLADSNLLLPPDYLARLDAAWRPDTGLVSAPPLGVAPKSFWAEVECAFLNTYQGRWQYAADSIGYGFAQGKTLCLRRSALEPAGGFLALAAEVAEDAAATRIVRGQGLKVRLVDRPFEQPLGPRSRRQVWERQVRWAQLRRLAFPLHFSGEVLTTPLVPAAAAWLAADELELPASAAAALVLALWHGTEAALARAAGIAVGWRTPLAWLVRDSMIPALWLAAWLRSGYEWHGNRISLGDQAPDIRSVTDGALR